jgi:hypothetical protein
LSATLTTISGRVEESPVESNISASQRPAAGVMLSTEEYTSRTRAGTPIMVPITPYVEQGARSSPSTRVTGTGCSRRQSGTRRRQRPATRVRRRW